MKGGGDVCNEPLLSLSLPRLHTAGWIDGQGPPLGEKGAAGGEGSQAVGGEVIIMRDGTKRERTTTTAGAADSLATRSIGGTAGGQGGRGSSSDSSKTPPLLLPLWPLRQEPLPPPLPLLLPPPQHQRLERHEPLWPSLSTPIRESDSDSDRGCVSLREGGGGGARLTFLSSSSSSCHLAPMSFPSSPNEASGFSLFTWRQRSGETQGKSHLRADSL
jgi:hypothetical protein